MSARTPLCRHWLGGRECGCQVDSLPSLSLPGLSTRSGGGILSRLLEEAGSAVEPNRALDRYGSVGFPVVFAVPHAVGPIPIIPRSEWLIILLTLDE